MSGILSQIPLRSESMRVPQGLGFWVAFERAIDPGDKERDLDVAIQRCHDAGATWIALRAGAGGANDAALSERSIARFLEAGIDPYVWIFAYERTQAKEIAGYHKWFVAGACGAVINAEFEYESATAQSAKGLVRGIRQAWAEAQGERLRSGRDATALECFVAHAPPDYLGAGVGHPLRDELVALDELCDAIMPQVYAWEHDDRGHEVHVDRVMDGYRRRGLGPSKVWPVGCTYRPKQRGGRPIPPMAADVEARRVADDVLRFLDHPQVASCPAPSLYSLDAISWINGSHDQVMNALRARTIPAPSAGPDTLPQTPTSKSSQSQLRAVQWSEERPAETKNALDYVNEWFPRKDGE